MNLNLKGFNQLVEDMGAALQSSASTLIDVSVGSVVRAIFEANASVVLWLQWLVVRVLQSTRASTSVGPDLDTWMADFSLARLPAAPATGIVTFSRFVSGLAATIPVGSMVKTADGSLSFSVTQDQSLSIWEPSSLGYVLPAGVSSADLPVTCSVGGSVGNVLAGTINVIAASLPGVDQVANAAPLSSGTDAESDEAFRTRFQSFLSSRSRATLAAVLNAVANVRQGLDVTVEENSAANGAALVGSFIVVIDDGSGYPSSDLISAASAAVDAVRPIGTAFAVIAPQVVTVDVSLLITLTPTAVASDCITNVQNYVSAYLNAIPIGKAASVARVAQSVFLADSGVDNVSNIQLNRAGFDVTPPLRGVIKSGAIVVTTNGG